uniref:T-cell surface glycoprotein CD3 epsilon chain n=1 Tax=Leptobrachium leishanense TaxID=445787 RepID=A0A8C5PJQ1_9ANUR
MKLQIEPLLIIGLCVGFIPGSDENDQDNFEVSISGTTIEIKCPSKLKGIPALYYKRSTFRSKDDKFELIDYNDSLNGDYECYVDGDATIKGYLYLKVYVCENCKELSVPVVAGVLIGDCLVTIGVAVVIYFGCKKKSGLPRDGGMSNGGRNRGNKERPPPVPNPDYEELRGKSDMYNTLQLHLK